MSQVTGEKQWSSQGKTPAKFQFALLPAKEWEAIILGNNFEIAVANRPGAIPYIKGRLEIVGSAVKEGGKNSYLFPSFFLKTTPGKDGISSPDRASGVLGFARALGEQVDFPIIEMKEIKEVDGQEVTETVELLDPQAVLEWFKAHAGMTLRLRSKQSPVKNAMGEVQKDAMGNVEKRSEVDYYIESTTKSAF